MVHIFWSHHEIIKFLMFFDLRCGFLNWKGESVFNINWVGFYAIFSQNYATETKFCSLSLGFANIWVKVFLKWSQGPTLIIRAMSDDSKALERKNEIIRFWKIWKSEESKILGGVQILGPYYRQSLELMSYLVIKCCFMCSVLVSKDFN